MSFVEWATLIVLLVVGAAGLYAGLATLVGKHVGQEKATTTGRHGKVLVALFYLLGGAVALVVAILWLLSSTR